MKAQMEERKLAKAASGEEEEGAQFLYPEPEMASTKTLLESIRHL